MSPMACVASGILQQIFDRHRDENQKQQRTALQKRNNPQTTNTRFK